jgi:hypothetical protein
MNPLAMQQPAIGAAQVSHDSPKVHLIGVKHEMAERGENIRRKNNSLSCFTLSPAPSRLRVYARDGGERVNLGNLVRRPAWRPSRRRSPGWPTLATSRPLAATIPSPARRDTRPQGGPRGVCQSGRVVPNWDRPGLQEWAAWFLPGGNPQVRHAGTATISSRVCFRGPNAQRSEML